MSSDTPTDQSANKKPRPVVPSLKPRRLGLQVVARRPRVDCPSRRRHQASTLASLRCHPQLPQRAHQVVPFDFRRPLVRFNVQPVESSPVHRVVHVVPAEGGSGGGREGREINISANNRPPHPHHQTEVLPGNRVGHQASTVQGFTSAGNYLPCPPPPLTARPKRRSTKRYVDILKERSR